MAAHPYMTLWEAVREGSGMAFDLPEVEGKDYNNRYPDRGEGDNGKWCQSRSERDPGCSDCEGNRAKDARAGRGRRRWCPELVGGKSTTVDERNEDEGVDSRLKL